MEHLKPAVQQQTQKYNIHVKQILYLEIIVCGDDLGAQKYSDIILVLIYYNYGSIGWHTV